MLLNFLQCTGKPTAQDNPALNANGAEAEKLCCEVWICC